MVTDTITMRSQVLQTSSLLTDDVSRFQHLFTPGIYHLSATQTYLKHLRNTLSSKPLSIRSQWAEAIHQARKLLINSRSENDLFFELGTFASRIRSWRLAATLFEDSLNYFGDNCTAQYNCSFALSQLGLYQNAIMQMAKVESAIRENKKYSTHYDGLHTVQEKQALFPETLYTQLHHDTRYISLALIGEHFSRTLFMLQQNDDIRAMTRLTRLLSVEHTGEWIREQMQRSDKHTFAVIHGEYGMVGIAAFEQYGNGALFYYWIGEEFQNAGFGTSALQLLLHAARFKGVELIFSSVFDSNNRSKQVLSKNGFTPLSNMYETGNELLPVYYKDISGAPSHNYECACSAYENIATKAEISIKKPIEVVSL